MWKTFPKCLLTALFLLHITSYVSAATLVSSSEITKSGIANAVVYQTRDIFQSMDDPSVNRATSEHFQIIWGNNDNTGIVNLQFVQGNLANLEAIRSCYVNKIGLQDTGRSRNPAITGNYKTNIYIAETGLSNIYNDWAYMNVDWESFGFSVMMPAAMRVDPPSWVVPHELAHIFEFHNRGFIPYTWAEGMANFMRNEYLNSEYYSYGGTIYGPTSDFFAPYVLNSEVHFPHTKNWYDTWPIFLYINENPDSITGLGHQAMLNVITSYIEESTYFRGIEIVTGVSIKDILGGMARRLVTMDFKAQISYLHYLSEFLAVTGHREQIYTTLINESDGWMTVPANKAPQQTGFNIIPLNIALPKTSITVNFQGTSTDTNADWRVSIVTVSYFGATRYSSMWSKGNNTINLNQDETNVYLVVVATPSFIPHLGLYNDGITYPYRVQVTTH